MEPRNLAEAVVARAAAAREQPALIFHAGGEWRWRSWEWLSRGIAALASEVAPLAGRRVTWPWLWRPGDVTLDLALQRAGALAAPRWQGVAGRDEARIALETLAEGRASRVAEGRGDGPLPRLAAGAVPGPSYELSPSGGGVVLAYSGDRSEIDGGQLLASARALGPALAGKLQQPPGGEVVLCEVGPDAWEGRVVSSWALQGGGTLVLEPKPEGVARSLYWSRPSVAVLSAACATEIGEALAEVGRGRRRARALRRRLRRLRVLVLVGDGEERDEAAELWRDLLSLEASAIPPLPGIDP